MARQFIYIFKKHYHDIQFHPMDWIIIIYALVIGLLIIPFHQNLHQWYYYPIIHFMIIMIIPELINWYTKKPTRILALLRTYYPVLLIALAWREMGYIVNIIFPFYMSAYILAWDKFLFGVYPTVWVQQFFNKSLNEIMYFCYASYYFIIPIATFPLFLQNQIIRIMNMLTFGLIAYAISYFLFLLIPSESPRHLISHLHTIEPEGFIFTKFIFMVQSGNGVRGAAFPSSHVSAAVAALWATCKYYRPSFWILLPMITGMTLATVYCQYHHAVDAIAGILIGSLAYLIGKQCLNKYHSSRLIKDK